MFGRFLWFPSKSRRGLTLETLLGFPFGQILVNLSEDFLGNSYKDSSKDASIHSSSGFFKNNPKISLEIHSGLGGFQKAHQICSRFASEILLEIPARMCQGLFSGIHLESSARNPPEIFAL